MSNGLQLKVQESHGLFAIVNKDIIPKRIRLIIPDIDGTLMAKVRFDDPMKDKILSLATNRVHQSPITGRGVAFIEGLYGDMIPDHLMHMFRFYAEYGLIDFDLKSKKSSVSRRIDKNHPILDPEIRNGIASLIYQMKDLKKCYSANDKAPDGYFIMTDPKGDFYFAPENISIANKSAIWDEAKTVMMTAAMLKGQDGSVLPSAIASQDHLVKQIRDYLERKKVADMIDVIPATSATDLLPKVKLDNGEFVTFDKDIAAGNAIVDFANEVKMDLGEACRESIGLGDSGTDIRFSVPIIESKRLDVAMFFVGPGKYFTPRSEREMSNIAGVSSDVLTHDNVFGPRVTLAILNYLTDHL